MEEKKWGGSRKGAGRKPTGKNTVNITLTLKKEEAERLKKISENENLTISQLVSKVFCLSLLFFLFTFVFLSCSNSDNKIVTFEEDKTIKNIISLKEEEINWTNEIEKDILSKDISSVDFIPNKDYISIEALESVKDFSEPLLPSLKGFGSLDTSSIPYSYYQLVLKTCDQMLKDPGKNIEVNFENDYLFNYVLFLYDLKSEWKKYFYKAYPEKGSVFTSYIIGMQNESFDLMQIPVRFYCNYGYIDLIFDIGQNKKDIKIQNIEILRWEAQNGK